MRIDRCRVAHGDAPQGRSRRARGAARRSLGRQFGWLWAAYAVSTFGTWLAFDAFGLIAILVLHAGPTKVSMLAAAGLAVGAAVALPLGPWVEFRRKRPVMVAMDLTWFAALISVPAAFALGWLSFAQLLVVSVIVAAASITFNAASGACLKALVQPQDLLVANGRFKSTTGTATALGAPLGGAAIGLFGPVTTVVADAVSYLLSAAGIRAIGRREPRPARTDAPQLRAGELLEGWRYILTHPLFFNTILVNGLIMATSPLLAVLMLGRLDHLHGRVQPGVRHLPARLGPDGSSRSHPVRVVGVTSKATIAALTALWGLLASITSPRTAIAIAGLLILTTPLLLPRHGHTPQHEREQARSHT